jgi:hypothetical protein
MTGVPEPTPVTRPVVNPTVASELLLLLQVPPATPSLSCVVAPPEHTVSDVPVIGVAAVLTVNIVDVEQVPIV